MIANMCRLILVAGAASVALALCSGCSQGKITAGTIRRNMSPDLESLAKTHEMRLNDRAKTWDVNARQIWDDIDGILFLDRPLRLSRYPIP